MRKFINIIENAQSNLDETEYQWAKRFKDDAVVMIDVAKMDASFQNDIGFYVGPNGEGGQGNRYAKFGEWVKKGIPIEMSEVSVGDHVSFINGRHRFAWMRDQGVKTLPVACPPEQAEEIKRRFGA